MLVAMNYQDKETFLHDLDEVMRAVHEEFKQVVADDDNGQEK